MNLTEQLKARMTSQQREHFDAQSPKQKLVTLTRYRLISQLQAKAGARAMDAAVAAGESAQEAYDVIVEEISRGRISVGVKRDKGQPRYFLKLVELRADPKRQGLSSKQELLELRNAGSLTPVQTKQAAQEMAKGLTVEQALVKVGAEGLLEGLEETGPIAPDDLEGSEEPVQDPEPTPEPAKEPSPEAPEAPKAAKTLQQLIDGTEEEIAAALPKINAKPALKQLWILEQEGKARKGVSHRIQERGFELGLTEEDFAQVAAVSDALKAPDDDGQGAGKDAYTKHIEGEDSPGE